MTMLGATLVVGMAAASAAGGDPPRAALVAALGPEPLPASAPPTTEATAAPAAAPAAATASEPAPSTTSTTAPTVIHRQPPRAETQRRQPTASSPAPQSASVEAAIQHWFPDVYSTAYRIARCESGLNPQAVSRTNDHGLFQLNAVHRGNFASVTGVSWESGVYDAFHNSHYARHLYNHSGWRPWNCA